MFCEVCGIINLDEDQDPEFDDISHFGTIKHICNTILYQYKVEKGSFSKNRDGVCIFGEAHLIENDVKTAQLAAMTDHAKIRTYVKPKQVVNFNFSISNEMNDDILIVGIHLAHPQPQFDINKHPYIFGETPHVLKSKSKVKEEISIKFLGSDIGQYEMPIMFTFHRQKTKKNTIFIREMVVMVEENPQEHKMSKSPFTGEKLQQAEHFIPSLREADEPKYKIPPFLKILFPRGLEEKALEGLKKPPEVIEQIRRVLIATRAIFDEGITKDNYMLYFHHLLWWEETIVRINLRKYNMPAVKLVLKDNAYVLEVPGLSEKRPSLLRGDRIYLQPKENQAIIFESIIKHIDDNFVHLGDLDIRFDDHYRPDALFVVRFIMSRIPMERSHEAISRLFTSQQECRVFPVPTKYIQAKPITKFYNPLIRDNKEQREAVEHIVSGTSGKAPYIVFGPPGTGKTMTIVEAIIQLVALNPRNRIMVCTDSNMAADHIALMLLKYNKVLNINNFILRANSQSREWSIMPSALAPISNGTSYDNFVSLKNDYVANFRVVVTTLMHAAKYASARSQGYYKLKMSHLFIDEAAQASEPHSLVPISGLLTSSGQLVLAGDPQQLGPVLISREASRRGLGASLLERLLLTHTNLYENNPSYMTMLVKNFRSDADILKLPNQLFYKNELIAMAPPDPISKVNILGERGAEESAIVFHAVHSREQKNGNAPSYFNEKELDMLKRYVKALIHNHNVSPEDIGIIAPYIRQVYKMKAWLSSQQYQKIEVGTVEAFQGKEKRVILVSTVRANCRLLDYDALYGLGFLVDDKRFNVTLTRAKAKLVIIGNPTCLCRDVKWELYMAQCKEHGTYFGHQDQQLDRTAELLKEVAKIRFNRCGLTDALKDKEKEREKTSATR